MFCSRVYVKGAGGGVQNNGNGSGSTDGTDAVRVQVERQDLDGMYLKRLNQLGLEAANPEELKLEALTLEIQFLRMKYDALVVGMSLLTVWFLKKWVRK